jgi:prepilin-type processing-associated H-X9-DG protein
VRKLLILLVVLAAIGLVADFAARAYSESQAANVLKTSLHLSKKPSVSLGGFPFLVHLATEHFDSVVIEDAGFKVAGLPIRKARIELDRVRFSLTSLVTGGHGEVEAKRGEGTAELTAEAITAAFRKQGVALDVGFVDGHVEVTSDLVGGTITADLSISGRDLVLSSRSAAGTYSITMPRLIPGIRYSKAEVRGDVALIAFEVEGQAFKV